MTIEKEEMMERFKDKVRNAVLDTLDSASPSGSGWIDKDLPNLFKALDAHAELLFLRLYQADHRDF